MLEQLSGYVVFDIMKSYLFIIAVAALFFAALPSPAWAIGEPVWHPTVPPSSIRSGLIRSPDPIDTSTNLIITGNVRGGRHFRGILPYYAPSSFGGTLGSSTLDSFLRYSAGSEDFGQFSGKVMPYYSPTGTVTVTMPGYRGVVRPPAAALGLDAPPPDALGDLTSLPSGQIMPGSEAPSSFSGLRPLSVRLYEPQQVIPSNVDLYMREQTLTPQQQFWMKRYKQEPERQEEKIAEPEKGLTGQQIETIDKGVIQRFQLQLPTEQTAQKKQPDIYEQMKQRISELQKAPQELPPAEQTQEPVEDRSKPAEDQTRQDFQRRTSAVDELLSGDLSTRARTILGPYKSFAAFSKDKFNQNMQAGEQYLKQGKYYRAVDAYTLALIYKPADPLAYAGKSLALFAAGEYMSSALFLSRAMELFPEYASLDIDIVALTGDRDILETRAADAEQWLQKTDIAELHFLLAYVYHRLGRLEEAGTAINAAYEKMPDAPAVIALKKAIESTL